MLFRSPAGAPAAFGGAVGQFKVVSKVVPDKAAVGEPVTWTLELSGTGNWPDLAGLPAREVSKDFQVVQPKAKRTPAEGKLFDVTLAEDVVLVPSKPGNYTLGPVTFTYFDPQSGSYQTLTTPRTALTIAAPAAPQFNVVPTPAGRAPEAGPGEVAPAPVARRPVTASALPAGIPRDPLPGRAAARSPLSFRTLVASLVTPFAVVIVGWGFLAWRRARSTDPIRPRREARDRLTRTLASLQNSPAAGQAPLLLAWQRDTAVLWQLAHAAPPAAALRAPEWSTLWAEADRALYGAKIALPSDWVARAQAALVAKTVPGFKPWRLFLPQNLMPFAALLALGFFTSTVLLRAAELDGAAAYAKADFPAAEKVWREAIEKTPTNWIARHNLSLALEQQERPGEAAAQAAAAFVQNPAEPAVRWHFGHAADKLGTAPAPLAGFVAPGFFHSLAQLASPASWQLILVAAAWVTAAGLGGLLYRAYGQRSRFLKWTAITMVAPCATRR